MEWDTPTEATFRISAYINEDGDFATEDDDSVGKRAINFGNISASATFAELYQGGAEAVDGVYGLVTTFVTYVLQGFVDASTARKVVTYTVK